jgi:hypothetical protein
MGWIVLGVLVLAVAGALEWSSRQQRRRHHAVAGSDTTTCGDVLALFDAVEGELGKGTLTRPVQVRAAVAAAGTAPLSGSPAGWFRAVVTERYTEWEEPDGGDEPRFERTVGPAARERAREEVKSRRLVERSKVHEEHDFPGPLVLDDGSGRLTVDIGNALVEHVEQVLDRLDPDPDHREGRPGRVGLHHAEWVVAPGTEVTVVGAATRGPDGVVVGDPKGAEKLIVTTRTRDEVVASSASSAQKLRVAAALAAAAGLILVVAGLVT